MRPAARPAACLLPSAGPSSYRTAIRAVGVSRRSSSSASSKLVTTEHEVREDQFKTLPYGDRFKQSPDWIYPWSKPTVPSTESKWSRPIPENQAAVYDSALAFLNEYRSKLEAEVVELKKQLEKEGIDAEKKAEIEFKIEGLEIKAYKDHPEQRWEWENDKGDRASNIHRYFSQDHFFNQGAHTFIVNRMKDKLVIPDVLPTFSPSVGLYLKYPKAPPAPEPQPDQYGWIRRPKYSNRETRDHYGRVVPGAFIPPSESLEAPSLEVQVFHREERLYTLFLVDHDVPHPTIPTFTSYLHWAIPNIPISARTTVLSGDNLPPASLNYIPPHPHKGTPYHRYTFVLVEQKDGQPVTDLPDVREGFNLKRWMEKMGTEKVRLAGATFINQLWEEEACAKVWKDILQKEEVKYQNPEPTRGYHRRAKDVISSLWKEKHFRERQAEAQALAEEAEEDEREARS